MWPGSSRSEAQVQVRFKTLRRFNFDSEDYYHQVDGRNFKDL